MLLAWHRDCSQPQRSLTPPNPETATADFLCLCLAPALPTMGTSRVHYRICPPLGGQSVPWWRSPSPPTVCCESSHRSANDRQSSVFPKVNRLCSSTSCSVTQHCEETARPVWGSAPGMGATALPSDWLRRTGPWFPMPSPTQLQKTQRRFQPISLSLGKDKFRNEKCLVQRFSSLMGSINISLISKPTENGPLILKFTPLPYSVFSPSMPARH